MQIPWWSENHRKKTDEHRIETTFATLNNFFFSSKIFLYSPPLDLFCALHNHRVCRECVYFIHIKTETIICLSTKN